MIHHQNFEVVDNMLRRIRNPLGGLIAGGDFRESSPIFENGSSESIIVVKTFSYLWGTFNTCTLPTTGRQQKDLEYAR